MGDEGVTVHTAEGVFAWWDEINATLVGAAVVLGAVGLAVASATTANAMLLLIEARTPELAVRMAVGATPRAVAAEVLLESMLIGLCGGMAGTAALAAAATALSASMGLPLTLGAGWSGLGVGSGVAAGLVAGYLPARAATRHTPAELFARA